MNYINWRKRIKINKEKDMKKDIKELEEQLKETQYFKKGSQCKEKNTEKEFEKLDEQIKETQYYKMMHQLLHSLLSKENGFNGELKYEDKLKIVDHMIDQHLLLLWQTILELPTLLIDHRVKGKIDNKVKKFSKEGIKQRTVKRSRSLSVDDIEKYVYSNYKQPKKKIRRNKHVSPLDKLFEDFSKKKKKIKVKRRND